jgi:hypothetical protein
MTAGARKGRLEVIKGAIRLPLALMGPAFIIFVSSSIGLLRRNSEYFEAGLYSALPVFLAGGIYLLIGIAVCQLSSFSKILRSAFYAYLLSGPLWIAYSAFQGLTGKGALIGFVVLAAIGGAYVTHARRLAEPLVSALSVFALAILAMTVFDALHLRRAQAVVDEPAQGGFEREAGAGGGSVAASLPDIYHIVFDEFQTDLFAAVLNDNIKRELRGVTWFPNSSTPFGRTEMALASLFSGAPYDYREPPLDYIRKAFTSRQSLLTQLRSLGYQTIGLLHVVYPRRSPSPFEQTYFHKDFARTSTAEEQRGLFVSLWLYAYLPESLTRHLLPEHHFDQLTSQTLLPNDAPFVSLMSFRRFLEWESATSRKGGRYIFVHLILPHFPNVLAPDCSYRQGRKTTILDQTSCAVREIGVFLELLRDQGRFKDALVLMHGDHGSRYVYEDGTLRLAQDRFYGPDWSWARSRPLVLIKPAGVGPTRDLMMDERATDLFDLFPTVLANLGKSAPIPLAGSSLLAEPAPERQRFYHFYDKDRAQIVDGTLKRYRILEGDIAFDTEIPVPK